MSIWGDVSTITGTPVVRNLYFKNYNLKFSRNLENTDLSLFPENRVTSQEVGC